MEPLHGPEGNSNPDSDPNPNPNPNPTVILSPTRALTCDADSLLHTDQKGSYSAMSPEFPVSTVEEKNDGLMSAGEHYVGWLAAP